MIDALFQGENYQLARQLLDAAVLRHQAIASNIANAETPGYKRVDLAPDFTAQLTAALQRGESPAQAAAPRIVEDATATAMRPDGNNVQIEKELLQLGRNSSEFNFLAQVVTQDLRSLRVAISGRSNA
jgi:flagellar basal-body rod protein FlgB